MMHFESGTPLGKKIIMINSNGHYFDFIGTSVEHLLQKSLDPTKIYCVDLVTGARLSDIVSALEQ
jgi:hypothetical protein